MEPYEWMVAYTPQRDWIEGHGRFIWLAEVFGLLGGGLYFVAMWRQSLRGMLLGWLLVAVLKGGFHLAHLGRPARFWRLFLKPKTSWLARGLLLVALFCAAAAVQMLLLGRTTGPLTTILDVLVGFLALLVMAYSGFVMNCVHGIPLWNSGLLPVLLTELGLLGGVSAAVLLGLPDPDPWVPVLLLSGLLGAGLLTVASHLSAALHMGPTARHSALEILRGGLARIFWAAVFVSGFLVPAASLAYMAVTASAPGPLAALVATGIVIGVFGMSYCLLKAGEYRPLTPLGT